ncbi:MAG: hypothetical protein WA213_13045 [Terriglobales bacterium]
MRRWVLVVAMFGLIGFCATAHSAAEHSKSASAAKKAATPTTQWDRNLLKNGGGEVEGKDSKDVRGWKGIEGLSDSKYGSESGEWDWGLSGCTSCGNRYLRLAFDRGTHELATSQTVNVSPSAAEIDKGDVTAEISAYLGGFRNSNTVATLKASFQDAADKELGAIETKPYDTKELPKAAKGSTGLVECKTSGAVPSGTKTIVFTWKATATDDSGDYLGLGDNFSLVLSKPKKEN